MGDRWRWRHWWWDREMSDPADWFEDPRDQPESPSFEKLLEEYEPRIDCWWDEQAEDRVARGKAV